MRARRWLSCFAERRRAEIGIRRALGADTGDIAALMLRRHAPVLGAGLAVGLGAAWAVGRALAGGPGDIREVAPLVAASVLLSLAVIAAIAGPTARALGTTPLAAMRGMVEEGRRRVRR